MAFDIRPAHLRALAEIVRRGSFSRAAEALRLSQPAVSLQIRQLETACGVPLLERGGKRSSPTEAGRSLLARAEPALAELDAAVRELRRRRGEIAGRARLGAGATASTYLLPPILGRLRTRYPGLEILLVTGYPAEIVAAVVENDLDAGVVALPVAGRALAVAPILDDPLVGIGPPADGRRSATADDLARHPLVLFERRNNIRHLIDAWFRRARVAPQAVMDLGNVEAIKKLAAAGFGLSIVPAMAVRDEARRGELTVFRLDPPLTRQLAVVRRRDKAADTALATVLAALAPRGGSRS